MGSITRHHIARTDSYFFTKLRSISILRRRIRQPLGTGKNFEDKNHSWRLDQHADFAQSFRKGQNLFRLPDIRGRRTGESGKLRLQRQPLGEENMGQWIYDSVDYAGREIFGNDRGAVWGYWMVQTKLRSGWGHALWVSKRLLIYWWHVYQRWLNCSFWRILLRPQCKKMHFQHLRQGIFSTIYKLSIF